MKLREILNRINDIRIQDFNDANYLSFSWDGELSFNGIKRMIYGLWNKGITEEGFDMIHWMSPKAKQMYLELMEEVKDCKIEITKPC